jgi:DNA-binding NarL/FixJ family response regulator/class 3 adenylate cyclase
VGEDRAIVSEARGAQQQSATVTVVFTDVEGSTPLLERLGEERYLAALNDYEALVAASAEEHGGTEELSAGDGHLLAFPGARGALRCAVALQRAVAVRQPVFKVRMGVHAGELERVDGRLRGRALVKAARIGALARGGEVLASTVVRELADVDESDGDVWFEDTPDVELRGLRGRHALVSVRWSDVAPRAIRVVIADDAAIVRDGVAALLREHGVDVVATATDADSLEEAVARHRPDLAVVDIRMPPTHTDEGLVAAEHIRRSHPDTGVLVLSQHVEPAFAQRLVGGGEARTGYLLKDRIADVDALLDAVRRVARGGCVVDPGLAARLVERADAGGSLRELTDREREVLGLLAQGLSNRAIAERLVVTGRTVETHISQIFAKLGLRDEGAEHRRVAAVLTYLRATPAG